METPENRLGKAIRELEQARQILTYPNNLQPEEWLLLATLVGEADLAIREEQLANPSLQIPLHDEVITELRALTKDFTDPAFVRAAAPARRRNRELFL